MQPIAEISHAQTIPWASTSNHEPVQRYSEQASHINIPALPTNETSRAQESPSYASQHSYQSYSDQAQTSSAGLPNAGASYFPVPAFPSSFLTSPSLEPASLPQQSAFTTEANDGFVSNFVNPVDSAQATSIQHLLSGSDGSVALHLNGAGKGQPQSFTRVRRVVSRLCQRMRV